MAAVPLKQIAAALQLGIHPFFPLLPLSVRSPYSNNVFFLRVGCSAPPPVVFSSRVAGPPFSFANNAGLPFPLHGFFIRQIQ